jgi:hypothetical protein
MVFFWWGGRAFIVGIYIISKNWNYEKDNKYNDTKNTGTSSWKRRRSQIWCKKLLLKFYPVFQRPHIGYLLILGKKTSNRYEQSNFNRIFFAFIS